MRDDGGGPRFQQTVIVARGLFNSQMGDTFGCSESQKILEDGDPFRHAFGVPPTGAAARPPLKTCPGLPPGLH